MKDLYIVGAGGCGREVLLPRSKAEKNIRGVLRPSDEKN